MDRGAFEGSHQLGRVIGVVKKLSKRFCRPPRESYATLIADVAPLQNTLPTGVQKVRIGIDTNMNVVSVIVTELAVIDVTDRGLVLKEIASDTTVDKVRAATGADLIVETTPTTF